MIISYALCLIFSGFVVPTVLSQNVADGAETNLQEALEFSNIVRSTMQQYITKALPPPAKPEGGTILKSVDEGLQNCESQAKTSLNIEQYKTCSASLLHDGMAALGSLQAKYRPVTSGAVRKRSLFF